MQRHWSPIVWISYAMCVGVMGTALASPLYPLYQEAWSLRASDITQIFVLYMFGVLISLLFLGRLTQRLGFLPILRAGLILMTTGVLASAVAGNAQVFMLARLLIGLSSGMITTSAAVGMVQARPESDPRRVAAFTTVAMTLGFGLGPLIGGAMAQWLPHPLVTAYVPTLLMGSLAIYALFQLQGFQRPSQTDEALPPATWGGVLATWMPRIALPPTARWRQFWAASMSAFVAFGMFSLYASLAPSFMRDIVPWHGPVVSGLSIAMILFLSSAFQFMVRNVRTKTVVVMGGVALVLCNLLLMASSLLTMPLIFAISVVVTAFGHGLINVGGMGLVGKLSRPHTRAGLLATYLIVGYMGTIVPILGIGWLSDHLGLTRALVAFCCVMAALATAITWVAARSEAIPEPARQT
jgi:MFS family permease